MAFTAFAYHVHDPERYGVVQFDADRKVEAIANELRQNEYGQYLLKLLDAKAY